ncbi:hypothetical protein AAFF_G00105450 [Aldrovandia affinis]|uniref:Uncharacterized protein n=1 Tax=Aldrovandia affinis TaxID=143900 RepID=A0AAD7WXV1_9TELE|nr:hypothetical protein AAFF_G00105450 [Aldrovandia affinis]
MRFLDRACLAKSHISSPRTEKSKADIFKTNMFVPLKSGGPGSSTLPSYGQSKQTEYSASNYFTNIPTPRAGSGQECTRRTRFRALGEAGDLWEKAKRDESEQSSAPAAFGPRSFWRRDEIRRSLNRDLLETPPLQMAGPRRRANAADPRRPSCPPPPPPPRPPLLLLLLAPRSVRKLAETSVGTPVVGDV